MAIQAPIVLVLVATCLALVIHAADGSESQSFVSFETEINSVDDGNKVVTTFKERKSAPASQFVRSPYKRRRNQSNPPNSWNNRVFSTQIKQVSSNEIDVDDFISRSAFSSPDFSTNFGKSSLARSLRSTARTVESPALSVDTGGRPASGSVASEIAKMLNVKQGHYSNIYDEIDRPTLKPAGPSTTKRPADRIEEAARRAVVMMLRDRTNNQQSGNNKS